MLQLVFYFTWLFYIYLKILYLRFAKIIGKKSLRRAYYCEELKKRYEFMMWILSLAASASKTAKSRNKMKSYLSMVSHMKASRCELEFQYQKEKALNLLKDLEDIAKIVYYDEEDTTSYSHLYEFGQKALDLFWTYVKFHFAHSRYFALDKKPNFLSLVLEILNENHPNVNPILKFQL